MLCCLESDTMLFGERYYAVWRVMLCCLESDTMLFGEWYYAVWRVILCCLESDTMLFGEWYYAVWRVIICCLESDTMLFGEWYYAVWRVILCCLESDTMLFGEWYNAVWRVILCCLESDTMLSRNGNRIHEHWIPYVLWYTCWLTLCFSDSVSKLVKRYNINWLNCRKPASLLYMYLTCCSPICNRLMNKINLHCLENTMPNNRAMPLVYVRMWRKLGKSEKNNWKYPTWHIANIIVTHLHRVICMTPHQ